MFGHCNGRHVTSKLGNGSTNSSVVPVAVVGQLGFR